jgi:hypothetical protein
MDAGALAAGVLANLGVSGGTLGGADPVASFAALEGALAQIFSVYAHARGQIVLNLGNLLAGLETDAVYGQAAAAFQNMMASDLNLIGLPDTAGAVAQEPSFGVWV